VIISVFSQWAVPLVSSAIVQVFSLTPQLFPHCYY